MKNRTYNLFLRDSLYDPHGSNEEASYRRDPVPDAKVLYKVWLYLDGKDMPFVQSVRYHLHPTFRVQQYQIEKSFSNPNFALVIWTWGIFNVKAEVTLISGEILILNHRLTYANSFELGEEIKWKLAWSTSDL